MGRWLETKRDSWIHIRDIQKIFISEHTKNINGAIGNDGTFNVYADLKSGHPVFLKNCPTLQDARDYARCIIKKISETPKKMIVTATVEEG